ncbi:hypothetical protein [Synechococcus sp. MIT S9504]|uniref:hypothetical protein n=1 Tax=Synechococcus sp. MIT S9504 TaxID=1801628 RepID=UPI0007BAF721|nr:hypothetical protein [Synechococcus sp. MIT S9504]KZR82837.1 hypothetical protein MITS9504_03411 [Synechococcus sp. MIT S9504]
MDFSLSLLAKVGEAKFTIIHVNPAFQSGYLFVDGDWIKQAFSILTGADLFSADADELISLPAGTRTYPLKDEH